MASFKKNILTLIAGTLLAQALPLITSPILTRLFSAEDFGYFQLFSSVGSFFIAISALCYDFAIIIPKTMKKAINVFALSFLFTFIISAVVFLFFYGIKYTSFIKSLSPIFSGKTFAVLLPFFIFLMSANKFLIYWNNRKENFKRQAKNKVIQSLVISLSSIAFGYYGVFPNGLVVAYLFGIFVSVTILVYWFIHEDYYLLKTITLKKLCAVSREFRNFPQKTIFSSLINALYNHGKIIIFANFFSPVFIGNYSLCVRILGAPITLVSLSVADVLFKKAVDWSNNENYQNLNFNLKKVFLGLFVLGLIPATIIFLWGGSIFKTIFGSSWETAGKFASILSLSFLMEFSVTPFCRVFYVLKKQSLYLKWELIRFTVVFASIWTCIYYNFSEVMFLQFMAVSVAFSYGILLYFLNGETKKYAYKCLKDN